MPSYGMLFSPKSLIISYPKFYYTMKSMFVFIRQKKFLIGALAASIFIFSACKKALDVTETPASGVMAFNLIPDKPAIGFAISNYRLTNFPLGYTNYTGAYLRVTPGNNEIQAYDTYTDSIFATSSQNFDAKNYYSVFAVGANGVYKNVFVNDNLDSLPTTTGQAFVRYINAIPDSSQPSITIAANGTNLVNQASAFSTVSDFKPVAPGTLNVSLSNETNISATRDITVDAGKIYTILLVGLPAATDTAKAVKIRYILNGAVTP
jgi:hypothetical protein